MNALRRLVFDTWSPSVWPVRLGQHQNLRMNPFAEAKSKGQDGRLFTKRRPANQHALTTHSKKILYCNNSLSFFSLFLLLYGGWQAWSIHCGEQKMSLWFSSKWGYLSHIVVMLKPIFFPAVKQCTCHKARQRRLWHRRREWRLVTVNLCQWTWHIKPNRPSNTQKLTQAKPFRCLIVRTVTTLKALWQNIEQHNKSNQHCLMIQNLVICVILFNKANRELSSLHSDEMLIYESQWKSTGTFCQKSYCHG